MANIKSAEKRARKAVQFAQRNASLRSGYKTLVRKFNELLDEDPAEAEKLFPTVSAALDTAAGKGAIHKNTAGRKKSRLHRRLRARLADAPQGS